MCPVTIKNDEKVDLKFFYVTMLGKKTGVWKVQLICKVTFLILFPRQE